MYCSAHTWRQREEREGGWDEEKRMSARHGHGRTPAYMHVVAYSRGAYLSRIEALPRGRVLERTQQLADAQVHVIVEHHDVGRAGARAPTRPPEGQ